MRKLSTYIPLLGLFGLSQIHALQHCPCNSDSRSFLKNYGQCSDNPTSGDSDYVENCIEYTATDYGHNCAVCDEGYYGQDCTPNPTSGESGYIENCDYYYTPGGTVTCFQCDPTMSYPVLTNFVLTGCQAVTLISDCMTYVEDSNTAIGKCDECDEGFYLDTDTQLTCTANPTSGGDFQAECMTYTNEDPSSPDVGCLRCNPGYRVDDWSSTRACEANPVDGDSDYEEGCSHYHYQSNISAHLCQECMAGYSYNSGDNTCSAILAHQISSALCEEGWYPIEENGVISECVACPTDDGSNVNIGGDSNSGGDSSGDGNGASMLQACLYLVALLALLA